MSDEYSNKTDHELLHLYQEGDMDAFEQFYARHQRKLYRVVKLHALNDSMAEHCFQETREKLIEKIDHILLTTDPKPRDGVHPLATLYPYMPAWASVGRVPLFGRYSF